MADKKIKNEIDSDYKLIGLASSLKEYRLCHYLNQLLGCDFRKLKDLSFEPKDRTQSIQFSVFKAESESAKNEFTVFANKNTGHFLLQEVSNFDYVIQVTGKYEDEEMKQLLDGIRHLPEVVMTSEIPVKKIKSRERLIYEEEKPQQRLITTRRFR